MSARRSRYVMPAFGGQRTSPATWKTFTSICVPGQDAVGRVRRRKTTQGLQPAQHGGRFPVNGVAMIISEWCLTIVRQWRGQYVLPDTP